MSNVIDLFPTRISPYVRATVRTRAGAVVTLTVAREDLKIREAQHCDSIIIDGQEIEVEIMGMEDLWEGE